MGDVMFAFTAGSWVLVIVFVVAGLDAVLPFMPSETTVVAVGVVAAQTGHPRLVFLIAVAAAGAFVGDETSFRLGRRSDNAVAARLDRGRRGRFVRHHAQRMLHRRGGLLIVFARYLPAGRSATAFTAGVVGYPAARFRFYTAGAVIIWATQGAFLGYFGGVAFAEEPLMAFLAAGAVGLITMTSVAALQRIGIRQSPSNACLPANQLPD